MAEPWTRAFALTQVPAASAAELDVLGRYR